MNLSAKTKFNVLARGLALALLLGAALCHTNAAQPNVLIVITDDQGYGDFSLHGNPHLQTPAFDRFGREGIQFERYFVSPLCAPTRASLLTGRYWLRGGVHGVTQSRENLRLDEVTLPRALKNGGYRTGMFGKWHNGEQHPYTPPGRGFDEFIGFNNGHWNDYFDPELLRGSQPYRTKGYITDVLTDEAIAFIARNKGNPFFCYVAYNTPHSPYQVPDRYFNKFKAQGLDVVLAAVYGMCENIDDNFARLLGALDQHGVRENTIVLFMTDNGANTDRYNAGMRGRKGSVHEGGSRVPLLLQWPARYTRPQVIPQLAAHIDIYPTLLELCGVKAPPGPKLDGISLVPLLDGRAEGWAERTLFTQNGGDAKGPNRYRGAVRTPRYRAVIEAAPTGRKKADGGGWQLYDMQTDPGQKRDIASEQPAVVKQLSGAYERWYSDVTRGGFAKTRIPIGHEEHDPVRLYAPQADFGGDLKFRYERGNSHDWIAGWTSLADNVKFELDVVRPGTFEVEVAYLCAEADAGAKIRVSVGASSREATVVAAPAPQIPLPHRNSSDNHYVNRKWGVLKVGRLELAGGPQTLTIEALSKPGSHVMELKQVHLKRVR